MIPPRHVTVKDGDVLVLVGTMKGAFLLRSNAARTRWDVGGPYFPGQSVYAMAYDQRGGRRRLLAGPSSMHFGAVLSHSDDFGRTWTNPEQANVKFPEDAGLSLKNIWQIMPATAGDPDTLYCGVEPASLFKSEDAGRSWALVRGLHDHPHRPKWQPGGGGMCLHTIVPHPHDPDRLTIAISTAGAYRTDDGGRTWRATNRGVRADFLPEKNPEFGQCVHKVVAHPKNPDRLFLQNHWGLYRSDDGGDSWHDIANGVPSDFGFAMVMHPHDPECVYIAPLDSDMFRVMPEGKLRIYRTRNAGKSWEPLTRGLPQQGAYETVVRDAMDADDLNPAGIYFGTRRGEVWGSRDGGASWSTVISGLPPVVCVKTALIGEPRRASKPRRVAAARAKPAKSKPKAAARKKAVRKAAQRKTSRGRR
jgi:hypothetical protein